MPKGNPKLITVKLTPWEFGEIRQRVAAVAYTYVSYEMMGQLREPELETGNRDGKL